MKILSDIRESNALLQSYSGGQLQIVLYSDSLKRIAIRISSKEREDILYFIGVGCKSMRGHFLLPNVNLMITEQFDPETTEHVVTLINKTGGFQLSTTGGFSLAQGNESEFGSSFENFIIHE